jgi:SNF2 family DNA or RNA helicase
MPIKFNPFEYQHLAIKKMLDEKHSALFLDMGLGKTAPTLKVISELAINRFEVNKVLVIAPKKVGLFTWPAEIKKWDNTKNINYVVAIGTRKEREEALDSDANVYIINRANVPWLIERYGKYSNKKRRWGFKFTEEWPFDMVVVDESSTFKSNKSRGFKMLNKARPFIKRLVLLTGTPAPNGLLDLWSQVYLLDGGERLGKTFTEYREKYFKANGYVRVNTRWGARTVASGYVPREGMEDKIYDAIGDLCISMRDDENMPKYRFLYHEVEMSSKARAKYNKLLKERIIDVDNGDVDNDIVAGSAAVLSNKLLQLSNGAIYTEKRDVIHIHDEKIDKLKELKESACGKPILVAYSFKHDLRRILAEFDDAEVMSNDSDVVDRWNRGEIPMLVLHPKSAGHGLNLQHGSNFVVWFGLNWSLELYQQLNARLRRKGQSEDRVYIHHIVTKDTYDAKVVKALAGKEVTQQDLYDATMVWNSEPT